jgi:hypothetical protein
MADYNSKILTGLSMTNDDVKNSLIKFKFSETITNEQLAEHIGFTQDEIDMLKIFWKPAFNQGWIPLNRGVVKQWFCKNEKGKDSVNHFYTRVLLKYEENVDYKEIDKNDPLMSVYENYNAPKMANGNSQTPDGNRAKYYAITGECFKMVAMERNAEIRRYYIKVEQLAIFMKDYLVALNNYVNAKQISDLTTKVENQTIINARIQNYIDNTKPLEKNSIIYVATSKRYACENILKVGHIDSADRKKLKHRLAVYNTGKIGDDLFYFCYIEEVYQSKELDNRLKKLLAFSKYNKNKEMVVIHFDGLCKIIREVSENHDDDYEYCNKYITEGYKEYLNKPPVIPPPINISESREIAIIETEDNVEISRTVIDVSNLSVEDREAKIKEAFNKFIQDKYNKPNFDCDADTLTENVKVPWKEFKNILMNLSNIASIGKLKPSIWKTQTKTIASNKGFDMRWK